MTAFAGIVTYDGGRIDRRVEDRVCRVVAGRSDARLDVIRADDALFVQQGSSSYRRTPITHQDSKQQSLFVGSVQLDNRSELGRALRSSPSECDAMSDAELLMRMLERRADQGVAQCLGAFAFAHWQPAARRLTLGRDCFGRRALFFHRGRGFAAFASTLNALLALPDVPRELDETVLANFLALNLTEPRRTFYRGIERVPSRMVVTLDPDTVNHRHYWAPKIDAPPPYRRDKDYVDRARELLDQAVARATANRTRIAIATSGGLDSSAVAATAARLGHIARVDCYTLVPAAGTSIDVGKLRFLDERSKVEALGRMHPQLDLHFLSPLAPHRQECDETLAFAQVVVPVLNPGKGGYNANLEDAVELAGHDRLLTGAQGNFGLTWLGLFSLPSLLRDRHWVTFVRELSALARQSQRTLMRTLATEVVVRSVPSRMRRLIYRAIGRDPDDLAYYSALNPDFIAGRPELLREWSAAGFDPWFTFAGDAASCRAYHLFDFNQFARDRIAMTGLRRKFETVDPYADRPLAEFLLSVPEPMYRRNGVSRSFARTVLADRLPPEIVNEQRKGVQDVNWFRRLDCRRTQIANEIERLEGSPTARKLIDLPRLKRLVDDWPADEHAAQKRHREYKFALPRAVHVGNFIRWVEGGNA